MAYTSVSDVILTYNWGIKNDGGQLREGIVKFDMEIRRLKSICVYISHSFKF